MLDKMDHEDTSGFREESQQPTYTVYGAFLPHTSSMSLCLPEIQTLNALTAGSVILIAGPTISGSDFQVDAITYGETKANRFPFAFCWSETATPESCKCVQQCVVIRMEIRDLY